MLGGKGTAAHSEWFIPNSPAAPRCPLRPSPLSTPPSVCPRLVQGARSRPLPLPGPFGPPSPGHPAAPSEVAAAPTGNVCHVVWELAVEKRVSALEAPPTHARTCVPQGAGLLPRLLCPKPGPGWGKRGPGTPCGVRFRERAAPEPVFSPTRDRTSQL